MTTGSSSSNNNNPAHIGIHLFSFLLTGAVHTTKQYCKHKEFPGMHMNLGLRRIHHVAANDGDDKHRAEGGHEEEGKHEKHEKHEKHHHPHLALDRFVPHLHHHHHQEEKKAVVVEDLSKALIPILGGGRFAMLLHNFLTPEECASLIERAEGDGYTEAFIHGPKGGEILRKDIRNCGRRIIDDAELSQSWFHRVFEALEDHPELKEKLLHAPWVVESEQGEVVNSLGLHEKSKPYTVVGINERLRFLRYLPGEYFGNHQDNRYFRGKEYGERAGEVSHVTFLLYLNDTKKGGETRVHSGRHGGRHVDVTPQTGSVLLFDLDIWHEATKIVSGRKYCCRTEFMYSTKT